MKRLVLALALAACALTFGAMSPARMAIAGSCGLKPLPPIPPIGTTRCDAVCVCDKNGNNCGWQFVCS